MDASVLTNLGTCAKIICDANRLAGARRDKEPIGILHRMTPGYAGRSIFRWQNKVLPFAKIPPDVLVRGNSSFHSAMPRVHIDESKTTRVRLHDPDLVFISLPRTVVLSTSTQLLHPPTRIRSHLTRMIIAEATNSHMITRLAIFVLRKTSWHATMNVTLAKVSSGVSAEDLGKNTSFSFLATS